MTLCIPWWAVIIGLPISMFIWTGFILANRWVLDYPELAYTLFSSKKQKPESPDEVIDATITKSNEKEGSR